jgi:hypothetical protein
MRSWNRTDVVGVPVEQYLRLLCAVMTKLTSDLVEGVARSARTVKNNDEERIAASQDENRHWVVKTEAA